MLSGGSVIVKAVPSHKSSTDNNVTFKDFFSPSYTFCDTIPAPLIPMTLNINEASGLGPISTMKQKQSFNFNMNLNLQTQIPVIDLTTPENESSNSFPLFQIQNGNASPAKKQTKELSAHDLMMLKLEATAKKNLKQKAEKENSEQGMWSDLLTPLVKMNPQNHVQQPERKSSTNGKARTRQASYSSKLVAKKFPKIKKDTKVAQISRDHLKSSKTTCKPSEELAQLRLINLRKLVFDPVIPKTTVTVNSFLHDSGTATATESSSMTFYSHDDTSGSVSNIRTPTLQTMGSLVDAAMAEIFESEAFLETVLEAPHLSEPQITDKCLSDATLVLDSASTTSISEDAFVINGLDYYSSNYGPGYINNPAMYFDDPFKPPVVSTTDDSLALPDYLMNDPDVMECLEFLEEMLG